MSATTGNGSSAGRPRSEEAHRAILDATLELLAPLRETERMAVLGGAAARFYGLGELPT